ncbi:MAG: cytochrome C [Alphaproteobacteria bacterium]|nr:cytochrome C [Alphaproteobacteria bacterium]
MRRLAYTPGIIVFVVVLLLGDKAHAVPPFAMQTGQPCTACHIGAFGPQLTPLGRAFKIGGYTQTGGQGWQSHFPLAAMFLGSFTNTGQSQPDPAAVHFGRNNNFAADQISLFLAGRVTDYAGGFVQGTYSGIDGSFKLDNTDLRLTTPLDLGDTDLRLGLSVNNGPTVQDPYNSTYAWIFPFASSALTVTPTAQPLLAGGLIGNSIGTTVYGWYDRSLYLEAGLYNTYGPSLLSATGQAYGPGSTANPAPYVRVAYEWNWSGQSAHVGGLFLHSNFNPAVGPFSSDGSFGHDSFTDYAIDAGYQFLGNRTYVVTTDAILVHEDQNLRGTFGMGGAARTGHSLNQARASLSFFYKDTYGLTLGIENTWGTPDPVLYAPAPVTGSANGKPNSNAFIVEADWIPFGKQDSWAAPWVNLKLGLQYTLYTRFNGGTRNYDGFGRNAGGNNTLYAFAWLIF